MRYISIRGQPPVRDFAATIHGTEAPRISGRGGAETLATTLAITQAAQTCGTVLVQDMLAAVVWRMNTRRAA